MKLSLYLNNWKNRLY